MNAKPETQNTSLDDIDRRLLNDFQRGFPLSPTPYADMARELGISEQEVLARLRVLSDAGIVSRVGAVVRPHTVGVSTLAAIAVPSDDIERVATLVNGYAEVNHNYERSHELNLWFVVTAPSAERLAAVLDDISRDSGYDVLSFPLIEDYHIDLGFDLQCT